jgi:hypothetical protein
MDKEKYVEGLFAYYELGRIDVIKSAYVQGYVASASRYDTYVGRDRSAIELEVRRRVDIHACVKAYVETSIAQGRRLDIAAFADERFAAEPAGLQQRLVERVGAIISALMTRTTSRTAFQSGPSMTMLGSRLPVLTADSAIRQPRQQRGDVGENSGTGDDCVLKSDEEHRCHGHQDHADVQAKNCQREPRRLERTRRALEQQRPLSATEHHKRRGGGRLAG